MCSCLRFLEPDRFVEQLYVLGEFLFELGTSPIRFPLYIRQGDSRRGCVVKSIAFSNVLIPSIS